MVKDILLSFFILCFAFILPAMEMSTQTMDHRQDMLKQRFLQACVSLNYTEAQSAIDEWIRSGLEIGALTNAQDDNGQCPLHLVLNRFLARATGVSGQDDARAQIAMLTLLAKHRAHPYHRNNDGSDVLDLAVLIHHVNRDLQVFEIFLDLFGDFLSDMIFKRDERNVDNPLPHMVLTGSPEFAALFLSRFGHVLDLTIKNSHGETSIQALKSIGSSDRLLLVAKALCELNLICRLSIEDRKILGEAWSFLKNVQDPGFVFLSNIYNECYLNETVTGIMSPEPGQNNNYYKSLMRDIETNNTCFVDVDLDIIFKDLRERDQPQKGRILFELLNSAIRNSNYEVFARIMKEQSTDSCFPDRAEVLVALLSNPASHRLLEYFCKKIRATGFFEQLTEAGKREIFQAIVKNDNFRGFVALIKDLKYYSFRRILMTQSDIKCRIAKYIHHLLDLAEESTEDIDRYLIEVSVKHNVIDALFRIEDIMKNSGFYKQVIFSCLKFNNRDVFDIFSDRMTEITDESKSSLLGMVMSMEGREEIFDLFISHCQGNGVFVDIDTLSRLHINMLRHAYNRFGISFFNQTNQQTYFPLWFFLFSRKKELFMNFINDVGVDVNDLTLAGLTLGDLLSPRSEEKLRKVTCLNQRSFGVESLDRVSIEDDFNIFILLGAIRSGLDLFEFKEFGGIDVSRRVTVARFNGGSFVISLLDLMHALYESDNRSNNDVVFIFKMGVDVLSVEAFERYLNGFMASAKDKGDITLIRELNDLKKIYEWRRGSEVLDLFAKSGLTLEGLKGLIERSNAPAGGEDFKEDVNRNKRPAQTIDDPRALKKQNGDR